nr:MAG TPA: AAA ATPase [Caudoviricetes sp.]
MGVYFLRIYSTNGCAARFQFIIITHSFHLYSRSRFSLY